MQKFNSIASIILLLAVGYLLIDKFSATPDSTPIAKPVADLPKEQVEKPQGDVGGNGIAYVDLDTLNSKFTFLLDKLELMRSEQSREQKNFERKAQRANERFLSLQEQAYSMTPEQMEAASAEMETAQESLQNEQDQITERLYNLEKSIQSELDERIHRHLDSLNAVYGYDYILAKAAGSGVLVANDAFNITDEVLKSLNDEYKAEKAVKKD